MTLSSRLYKVAAFSTLAVYILSLAASPVDALIPDAHGHHLARGHETIARSRRSDFGHSLRKRQSCPERGARTTVSASKAPAPTSPPKEDAPPKQEQPKPSQPPAPPKNDPPKNSPPKNNPKPPPPPSNGHSGKAGIAWSYGNNGHIKKLATDKVSAMYTWSEHMPSQAKEAGLLVTPMLWGRGRQRAFREAIDKNWASHALFVNEPDHRDQANMSVGEAVQLWWSDFYYLKAKGVRLGSPAVTSGPAGKTWLREFMNACSGCEVDFIAVHWYGLNADEFIKYVIDMHNEFGLNIWVTEFAAHNFAGSRQASKDEIHAFMSKAVDFLDATPWVEKYFWLGFFPNEMPTGTNWFNKLIDSNWNPTDLGWQYLSW